MKLPKISKTSARNHIKLKLKLKLVLTKHRSQELVDVLQFFVQAPHLVLQVHEILVSDDLLLSLVVPASPNLYQQLVRTARLKTDFTTSG